MSENNPSDTNNNNNEEIDTEELRDATTETRDKWVPRVRAVADVLQSLSGVLAIITGVVGIWVLTGRQIIIPDNAKIFAVSMVGVGAVLSPVTIWGVKRLWNPPRVYLFDVDAGDDDAGTPIPWVAAPSKAKQLEVTSGTLNRYSVGGWPVWIGRKFDPNAGTIEGTWRGAASDTEILNRVQEIKANRGRNRYFAQIGQEMMAKMPAIVSNIEHRVWDSMSDDALDLSAHDPIGVRDEIVREVNAIDDAERPDSVEQAGMVSDEVDESVDAMDTGDGQ